jgi:hypothetical protein
MPGKNDVQAVCDWKSGAGLYCGCQNTMAGISMESGERFGLFFQVKESVKGIVSSISLIYFDLVQ